MITTLHHNWLKITLVLCALFLLGARHVSAAQAAPARQQPTVSIPTVTSSPVTATIRVRGDQDQINVRTGPGTNYPSVGILVLNETAPAIGRSPGGDWIKIYYPGSPDGAGWIYSYLVDVQGSLPVVEPPPLPTPRVTNTIDPTLAAQYLVNLEPTRLPTFTAPVFAPMPTYPDPSAVRSATGVPMGFVIIGLAVIGLFGLMVSLLRGR